MALYRITTREVYYAVAYVEAANREEAETFASAQREPYNNEDFSPSLNAAADTDVRIARVSPASLTDWERQNIYTAKESA